MLKNLAKHFIVPTVKSGCGGSRSANTRRGAHVPSKMSIARHRLGHVSPIITLTIYSHLCAKHDTAACAAINGALGQ